MNFSRIRRRFNGCCMSMDCKRAIEIRTELRVIVDDIVHIRLEKHVVQLVCNVYVKASSASLINVRKKFPTE
jgi:hypothetical protein